MEVFLLLFLWIEIVSLGFQIYYICLCGDFLSSRDFKHPCINTHALCSRPDTLFLCLRPGKWFNLAQICKSHHFLFKHYTDKKGFPYLNPLSNQLFRPLTKTTSNLLSCQINNHLWISLNRNQTLTKSFSWSYCVSFWNSDFWSHVYIQSIR